METKIFWMIAVCAALTSVRAGAQGMAFNSTGATAHASAMLDVSSTTKGMLVPRMTSAQRAAISSPATGLLVYQTDAPAGFYSYNGSAWSIIGGTASTAGGDLTGSYPNPTIAASSTTGGNIVSAINAGSSVVNPTNLGSGAASSSTYLRGDGTWATPSATPKYVIQLSLDNEARLTTTSTGVKDTVTVFGLGGGTNQWININGGSYIDPSSAIMPDGSVPMPFGGTINSMSVSFKFKTSTFLAIFGNYTLNMQLYYLPPPSGTLTGTLTFFPVPGASASFNLTSLCSICVTSEGLNALISGLSFSLAANSRLLMLVSLSSSTTPSSLQSLQGYCTATLGMQ